MVAAFDERVHWDLGERVLIPVLIHQRLLVRLRHQWLQVSKELIRWQLYLLFFFFFLRFFRLFKKEINESLVFGCEDFTDEEGVLDLLPCIGSLLGVSDYIIDESLIESRFLGDASVMDGIVQFSKLGSSAIL